MAESDRSARVEIEEQAEDQLDLSAAMGRGGRGGRRRSEYLTRDLTKGSIPRNLAFLAWPMVVESVLGVIDQMIDLIWAGRIGVRAIAGLGVAQIFGWLAMSGRMGFDMAMQAGVSRAVGAGNLRLANHVALQAFTLSGGFSVLMAGVGVLFTVPLLKLLGTSDEVVAAGAGYMRLYFVSAAAMAFRMMSGAALQASGDTLTPMKATTVVRVVHVGLSPFLVFGWWGAPAFGIAGAALANGIAQTLGASINLFVLFSGRSRLHLTLRYYRVDFPLLWRLIKVAWPASITGASRSISQLLLIRFITPFGDTALAAYSLTRRVETLARIGTMGLGRGSGVLVGQNLGAGQPERAKAALKWALALVFVVTGSLSAIMFAFPAFFLSIFNSDPDLLAAGIPWLRILLVGFLFMGLGVIFRQSFSVAGDTLTPMVLSGGQIVLEVFFAFLFSQPLGLGHLGVAWALLVANMVSLLAYVPFYSRGRWLRVRVVDTGATPPQGAGPSGG